MPSPISYTSTTKFGLQVCGHGRKAYIIQLQQKRFVVKCQLTMAHCSETAEIQFETIEVTCFQDSKAFVIYHMIQIAGLPNCIKSSYSNRKQLCLLPTPKKHKRDRNMSKQSEARGSHVVPISQSVMFFFHLKRHQMPKKIHFSPSNPSDG